MPQQLGSSLGFMIIIFAAMYFFMIRPTQKREKEVRKMRDNLKVGDRIITIGGIKGTILKLGDDFVVIESSNAKTKLEFVKSAVGTVIRDDSSEVVKETKEDKSDSKEEE
ncbi:preprotein translocase subunit YajC [Lagierella sp.]|uniref:preprotein translocase subunit YajC n=1 Tax=Lagierella sp. TaxID=2849657 RepID=UPI002602A6D3|nr:preprotein translocase subunit YajC [Lagierella sp.]